MVPRMPQADEDLSDVARLGRLITARHACISIVTHDEAHALELVRQVALDKGWDLSVWSVTRGVRDGLVAGSATVADTEHPAAALYHLSRPRHTPGLFVALDLAGHLRDERTLRAFRDAVSTLSNNPGSHLILIDHRDDLPPVAAAVATRFEVSFPDEVELEQILVATISSYRRDVPVRVNVTPKGLKTIIRNLRGLTRAQARQVVLDAVADDRCLDDSDIAHILAGKRQAIGGTLLEFVDAPVDMAEIGGMNRLKSWLAVRACALADDAVKFGIQPPRGVLMLGVQGAGKSLAAKAVATAWQRPLLRLDVGALYDKYIGESERRLRDALKQAALMSPIVLWVDEIEKAFASAASQSTDGGLSKRMFGHLLTWMQEHTHPVFLVATANDIEALPPELLRKGRFDEIFFVDLPNLEARAQIFTIHLKRRKRPPEDFDLPALAAASEGFSGSEIEQAVLAALHTAFAAEREVTTADVLAALAGSPPLSVTMAERIGALRRWAQKRCVPAD